MTLSLVRSSVWIGQTDITLEQISARVEQMAETFKEENTRLEELVDTGLCGRLESLENKMRTLIELLGTLPAAIQRSTDQSQKLDALAASLARLEDSSKGVWKTLFGKRSA